MSISSCFLPLQLPLPLPIQKKNHEMGIGMPSIIFHQSHGRPFPISTTTPITTRRRSLLSFVPNCSSPLPNSLCKISSNSHFPSIGKRKLFKYSLSHLVASLLLLTGNIPCCFAASEEEEVLVSSDVKINLESVLISIDDFFNQYPFFVAGVTFIWLVVIPLTQDYLKKFKFISANDAFNKLEKHPNSQLLDIRDKQSLLYLPSPNLKILNKRTLQVHFSGENEESFVREVLSNFTDPTNTIICVLDNFDGNSMKVAELLFKGGFKEAYAIKGGLRGKDGWLAIQETLLPPSMHVFPKMTETSNQLEMNGRLNRLTEDNGKAPSSSIVPANNSRDENLYVHSKEPTSQVNIGSSRSSSPYPNYPDMKPPSSPTPSKPLI